MAQTLTNVEIEVVILKAVWELVDSVVNYEVLSISGESPHTQIRFPSYTHQKFFNIVLVDFLSRTDIKAPIPKTSYLEGLRAVASSPVLIASDKSGALKKATEDFINWLEQEVEIDTWFPSLNVQANLKVRRSTFLRITGNISKHNFLRAFGVAEELQEIFKRSNIFVTIEEASMALTDFYERFHTDILSYHSSTIAEFLNNIRWEIYEYLRPEFRRSMVLDKDDRFKYSYAYPKEVVSPYGKLVYWDLMNNVRGKPYIEKFEVTKWLKLRY